MWKKMCVTSLSNVGADRGLSTNRRRPLWVVASETHFTVVFSDMPALACPEPSHLRYLWQWAFVQYYAFLLINSFSL
jgi:hypothetical protein